MYNLRGNRGFKPLKRRIFASTTLFLIVGVFLLPHYALASVINDENIIILTNQARLEKGLRELTANQLLSKAAYDKAEAIFDTQEFKHNLEEKSFSSWVKETGYEYQNVGENLAIDFITSEGTMKAWLESPSHKKNIMNPKFQEIGIAVKQDEFDGQESIVVVQIFGTPIQEGVVASTFEAPNETTPVAQSESNQLPKTLMVTNTGGISQGWLAENIPLGSEVLSKLSGSMEYYTQVALIILDYTDVLLMNYYYSVILLLLFVFTSAYIWHRKDQEHDQRLLIEHH